MTTSRFAGKVVIVTGGGSGIGAATAQRFAEEGATVIIAGRTRSKLDDVAAQAQGEVHVAEVDVTDGGAVQQLIDGVAQEHGRLDVLVNNAGTSKPGRITDTSDDDWSRVVGTNLDGVFYGCRAALPHLVSTGGCIVNVASVSGLGGDWGNTAYNAAKGGVVNLTRGLALESAAAGVRVNAVAPTLTFTDMNKRVTDKPEIMKPFYNRIPLGRGAQASEIAAAITFLASADASFITGVCLPVDGGLGASNGQPNFT